MQLYSHLLLLLRLYHELLVALNPIKSGNLPLPIPLVDYLLDGGVAGNHLVLHSDYVLSRFMAGISSLSVLLCVLISADLHLTTFDRSLSHIIEISLNLVYRQYNAQVLPCCTHDFSLIV